MEANNEVFETEYWKVFLMPNQTYLGYCSVSLKRRDCGDLADMTNDEIIDFLKLAKKLESAIKKAFGATMFNWTCLMNLAYQNNPPTPHMHWHFRPRYDHKVTFAGLEFVDQFFGQHYDWPPTERILNDAVREKIIDEIEKLID
ncbi:MAG: HIT family protein [Candidatus Pacebacteria bacterium]|nr:HIT family protein [Candidatus Paceibacterota bacterium]